jgi:hypothetical protein
MVDGNDWCSAVADADLVMDDEEVLMMVKKEGRCRARVNISTHFRASIWDF